MWEAEFDYADAELQALAATDWRQITDWHLSVYYVLNLVYHEPMQPELFRYLFPLCLALLARNAVNPWAMAITSRSLSCARYGGLISGGK
ncbi:putative cytoplasmic protein [Salmonella enterica subsp. enterica]|uniref:Putative cytoplasmic protein n=1 Tax=Salmonella enterica I TaxID=59201 RepID=A0A379WKS1_SALET|nr:putative cytoplasmic protein [Salmonella enterica subsp. enterica]